MNHWISTNWNVKTWNVLSLNKKQDRSTWWTCDWQCNNFACTYTTAIVNVICYGVWLISDINKTWNFKYLFVHLIPFHSGNRCLNFIVVPHFLKWILFTNLIAMWRNYSHCTFIISTFVHALYTEYFWLLDMTIRFQLGWYIHAEIPQNRCRMIIIIHFINPCYRLFEFLSFMLASVVYLIRFSTVYMQNLPRF